jgi:membrane-bound metal-dependent hydrolase YbcI (DUF457 family)
VFTTVSSQPTDVFPLGHATFGYLLYTLFAWTTRHRLPYGLTLGALLVGTQFPDLVDKPLVFAGVLPSGRALGHSLLFAAAVVGVLWLLARRYDSYSHLFVAFGFGHLSHVVGDVVVVDFSDPKEVGDLTYLLWPLLPAPEYTSDSIPPWVRIVRYYRSPELTPELVLLPVALLTFVLVELRRRTVAPK